MSCDSRDLHLLISSRERKRGGVRLQLVSWKKNPRLLISLFAPSPCCRKGKKSPFHSPVRHFAESHSSSSSSQVYLEAYVPTSQPLVVEGRAKSNPQIFSSNKIFLENEEDFYSAPEQDSPFQAFTGKGPVVFTVADSS